MTKRECVENNNTVCPFSWQYEQSKWRFGCSLRHRSDWTQHHRWRIGDGRFSRITWATKRDGKALQCIKRAARTHCDNTGRLQRVPECVSPSQGQRYWTGKCRSPSYAIAFAHRPPARPDQLVLHIYYDNAVSHTWQDDWPFSAKSISIKETSERFLVGKIGWNRLILITNSHFYLVRSATSVRWLSSASIYR